MSFSFTEGTPYALIQGGKYNGQTLYVKEDDKPKKKKKTRKCCSDCGSDCEDQPCCDDCQYVDGGCCGGQDDLAKGLKDLTIDGVFQCLPSSKTRNWYAAGKTGAGKSTFTGNVIEQFLLEHPDAQLIMFSKLKEDPAIDYLNPHRIALDERLVEDPINLAEEVEQDTIFLFDDIGSINDKKVEVAVHKLIKDVLELGRHYDCLCLVTNHLPIPTERNFARVLLNEMQSLCLFPKSGAVNQSSYILEKYIGLSKKQIKEVLKIDSRWINVFNSYPLVIVTEHRAFFPDVLL